MEAVVDERPILDYYVHNQKQCLVQLIDDTLFTESYSIAVSKGSDYKDKITKLMRTYKYDGSIDEIKAKWFKLSCKIEEDEMEEFIGLFILFIAGFIVCGLILLIEIILNAVYRRRSIYKFN